MARPVYSDDGRISNGADRRAKRHLPQRFVETFRCRACVNAGRPGILVLKDDRAVRLRVHCPVHGADPSLIHCGEIAQRDYARLQAESRRLERGGRPAPALAGVSLRPSSEDADWM